MLDYGDMLQLKRYNTPTIYNGWEAITKKNRLDVLCNREETKDFMPQMGPMVGRAITVSFQPANSTYYADGTRRWSEYRRYVASVPGPKIVVLRDLDSPDHIIGSFWGEVCANMHKALGCVGTITDGAIRDLDEMHNAGFKAIARRLCVGHAYSVPVAWDIPVEVYGCTVNPGDLIHADKHGFMVIPNDDQDYLMEAVAFMDANECKTVIGAARGSSGKSSAEICEALDSASAEFQKNLREFKSTIGL
jgi:4-hydroxy-4-methyl-2-oxoglutarate aldolase